MNTPTRIALAAGALLAGAAGLALAQQPPKVDAAAVDAVIKRSWSAAAPDWAKRTEQDKTMQECTEHHNRPPPAISAEIQQRETAKITYPADGKLMGDWKKGNTLARSGYGWRFTDYPPARENGGNCYACHQLDPKEIEYGTLGPSLVGYGKVRKFSEKEVKFVYDKVFNSHSVFPCSTMPRFGASGYLTAEQIRDIVGYVMSPDSPVNK